jgi:hypothetical protein
MTSTEPEVAPHRTLNLVGNRPIGTLLLAVLTLGSAVVFLAAIYLNVSIGETTSDSGSTRATNVGGQQS